MQTKSYKNSEKTPKSVHEPAVAYRNVPVETSFSESWNPNIPFHGTQEEWWEHFHRIEQGPFFSIEEADAEFEIWKKRLLASRT